MLFREEDEDLEVLPFADRAEAGRILAGKLSAYANRRDVLVVSKLGSPWNCELAMGAVAEGSVQILDLSIVKVLGVSDADIQEVAAAARRELEAREALYRRGRPPRTHAGS